MSQLGWGFLCPFFSFDRPLTPKWQIIQVTDIPYTLNGKRVEVLVKKVSCRCLVLRRGYFYPKPDHQWSTTLLRQPLDVVESRLFDILF